MWLCASLHLQRARKFESLMHLPLCFFILHPPASALLSLSRCLSSCALCQSMAALISWLSAKSTYSCTTVISVWKQCHAPRTHTLNSLTGSLAGCFAVIGETLSGSLITNRPTGLHRNWALKFVLVWWLAGWMGNWTYLWWVISVYSVYHTLYISDVSLLQHTWLKWLVHYQAEEQWQWGSDESPPADVGTIACGHYNGQ